MRILSRLKEIKARMRGPHEDLADEYTVKGYIQRVKEIKAEERKAKWQERGQRIIRGMSDFLKGFEKGAGINPSKKQAYIILATPRRGRELRGTVETRPHRRTSRRKKRRSEVSYDPSTLFGR
jgi:hypothetical protein